MKIDDEIDDDIGHVEGVTLVFVGATEAALKNMAATIGGDCTYCVEQASVTHTYESPYAIESFDELAYLGDKVDQAGQFLAMEHCCTCVGKRWHLALTDDAFEDLKAMCKK